MEMPSGERFLFFARAIEKRPKVTMAQNQGGLLLGLIHQTSYGLRSSRMPLSCRSDV